MWWLQEVVGGGWRNKLAYLGLADLQMPIIHTWNVSLNMWNYHINYRHSPTSPANPLLTRSPCCWRSMLLGALQSCTSILSKLHVWPPADFRNKPLLDNWPTHSSVNRGK